MEPVFAERCAAFPLAAKVAAYRARQGSWSCLCPNKEEPDVCGAGFNSSYCQSYMGHIQRSGSSPPSHNEITKFILVEKDTNKKDLKTPRSLAIPQSAQPVGELLQLLRLFSFRRRAGAAASRISVH